MNRITQNLRAAAAAFVALALCVPGAHAQETTAPAAAAPAPPSAAGTDPVTALQQVQAPRSARRPAAPPGPGISTTLKTGVVVTEEVIGTGRTVEDGATVAIHYVGRLEDGTLFDSSRYRLVPRPLQFTLGQVQVIGGFEQGVKGMKEGGKRKLIIPPAQGYGSMRREGVPPNSTLHFDIELVKVLDRPTTAPAAAAAETTETAAP